MKPVTILTRDQKGNLVLHAVLLETDGVNVTTQKVKKFTAKEINTIYKNFNTYCKNRGAVNYRNVPESVSFGCLEWVLNPRQILRLLP
ncbi:hypothetical protein D3C71_1935640 [compost metagenome]